VPIASAHVDGVPISKRRQASYDWFCLAYSSLPTYQRCLKQAHNRCGTFSQAFGNVSFVTRARILKNSCKGQHALELRAVATSPRG
jgi:hypothetical protein